MRIPTGFSLVLCLALALAACDSDPTGPTLEEEGPEGSGLAAGVLPEVSGSDAILVNGDMEIEAGWWFYGPQGTTQGYSTLEARSGTRSVQLSHPVVTGAREFSFAGQYMRVQNPYGKKFTLTARMKLEGVTGQGVAIAIRGDTEAAPSGYGEAFATTQNKRTLVGTTDWMEVSVELDGLEESIQSIAVYLILLSESSGTVYFDDVELHTSEWTPIRTLMNGGFEAGEVWPLHWWRGGLGCGNFKFGWHDVDGWEGARAVNISRNRASDSEFGFWAQTIFAEDLIGGSATLRARVKTDLVGQGVSLVIRGDDTLVPSGSAEAFISTQNRIAITGVQDWTEYSITMNWVPWGMKSITVYLVFLPETTGTVFFDAVSLEL
jgi:hypothetical protein